MTATHSDIGRIEPYWFGRPEAEIRAAVDARPEAWAAVPGYARYEWSDKGRVRSLDGQGTDGRTVYGQDLRTSVNRDGYVKISVTSDQGRRVTVMVHVMVLLAHHPAFQGLPAFPDGLETRHNPSTGPACNAYPECLWPGSRQQNEADKLREERPTYPCRNAARCGGQVLNEGRRCGACVTEVGRQAAEMLNAGVSLQDAARVFGYRTGDWTYRLAVRHGGYGGTREDAAAQRTSLLRRAWLRSRYRAVIRETATHRDRAAGSKGG